MTRLKHVLRAKAVLCPGLKIEFINHGNTQDNAEWFYEDGLVDYLTDATKGYEVLPPEPFEGCLLYTSPSPRDQRGSRMPSSA